MMVTPGIQRITGIGRVTETDNIHASVVYYVTFADNTSITVAGQCDALDSAATQLQAGPGGIATVAFPLTVRPNPKLWVSG